MNQPTKAACCSLLLHAALALAAVAFMRPLGPMKAPIMLDFAVLSASTGGLAEAAKSGSPAAKPSLKRQAVAAVKKKAAPQLAKSQKTHPKIERVPEALPVATAQQPAASVDDAISSVGMAAMTTGPAAAPGPKPAPDSPTAAGHGGGAGSGVYTTGQLDGPLTAMRKALPVYPHAAKSRRIEGWIKIKFVIDERGHVDQIAVLAADPQGVFEQSVLRCVAGWRFKPGTISGMAVKALVQQTIFFKLD
jgi:protein TonB